MFLFPWLDWGDDISDFEKFDFLEGQPILSVSSPCRSDLIWKFEKKRFLEFKYMASYGRNFWYMVKNGLLYMYVFRLKKWLSDFDCIEVHFEDFKILSLRNCCKNDEKMPKNPKNHEFSILDKSADLADINDLQIR